MLKNIISSIVLTVSIIGCGSGSNDNDSSNLSTLSKLANLPGVSKEIKKLAYQDINQLDQLSNVPQPKNVEADTQETLDCNSGGIVTYGYSDFEQKEDYIIRYIATQLDDCIINNITLTGDIAFGATYDNITKEQTSRIMVFISDLNAYSSTGLQTMKEDSSYVSEPVSANVSMITVNTEIETDDFKIKNIDLKSFERTLEDGATSSYEISGEYIINGLSFVVDESYDASLTPLVLDKNYNIQKGFKKQYKSGQNYIIVVEAVKKNILQITLDTDGDGKADASESINITDTW